MTQEQRSHFNQLYHGTGEMIHELCEDPIYQEGTYVFLLINNRGEISFRFLAGWG